MKKVFISNFFSIQYVLQDTLGEIVELHVYIRLLDSFVRKYVTAVNRNVIIQTVVKVTVRPPVNTVNQISSRLYYGWQNLSVLQFCVRLLVFVVFLFGFYFVWFFCVIFLFVCLIVCFCFLHKTCQINAPIDCYIIFSII